MIFREQGHSVGKMTADWPLQARFLTRKPYFTRIFLQNRGKNANKRNFTNRWISAVASKNTKNMANQTVIYQVNRDDLKELITQAVQDAVKDLQGNEAKPVEGKDADLMTREEVCKYLDVTAATLFNWNKRGPRT